MLRVQLLTNQSIKILIKFNFFQFNIKLKKGLFYN